VAPEAEGREMSETEQPCPHWDEHEFEEGCYGNRCKKCGLFYAYGCAPWDDMVDVELMTNEQLDAELSSNGLDPEELDRKMLARLIKARDEEGFDTPMLHEAIRQFSEKGSGPQGKDGKPE